MSAYGLRPYPDSMERNTDHQRRRLAQLEQLEQMKISTQDSLKAVVQPITKQRKRMRRG